MTPAATARTDPFHFAACVRQKDIAPSRALGCRSALQHPPLADPPRPSRPARGSAENNSTARNAMIAAVSPRERRMILVSPAGDSHLIAPSSRRR